MREFIPNVITPEEAKTLVVSVGTKDHLNNGPIVDKIKKVIESFIKPNWELPTHTKVEKHHKSHGWHVDTGSRNHMTWCDYGCSVLLTNTEDAGFLEYRDGRIILPEEHFCGLAIHSSDVEHRTKQPGNRVTFLAFIAEDKLEGK